MPYLNWTSESLRLSTAPHSRLGTELRLELTAAQADRLRVLLLGVLGEDPAGSGAGELRIDLPGGWTLYWKGRPGVAGESRSLLAHPQKDEWVGTVLLAGEHSLRFLAQLQERTAGTLSDLGKLSFASNLEVRLSFSQG